MTDTEKNPKRGKGIGQTVNDTHCKYQNVILSNYVVKKGQHNF